MATEALLTADEYLLLPENGQATELVRGKLVAMNVPAPRHGAVCARIVRLLGPYLDSHDRGWLMSNDVGVITSRDPDTVRGADVAFYSYARVPKGSLREGYLSVAPELVFEVLSPSDRWSDVLAKIAEYLQADVSWVCVLDPQREAATVFSSDRPAWTLHGDHELAFPEILPGFTAKVSRFFT